MQLDGRDWGNLMNSTVQLHDAWIPNLIETGSLLVLDSASDVHTGLRCGLMYCPACGKLAVITQSQLEEGEEITCGAHNCAAKFYLKDGAMQWSDAPAGEPV